MAYREDCDLAFLGKLKSKELDDLVYILTHDKKGNMRLTEELSTNDEYKKYYPHHSLYWKEIAGELQCYGANSISTIFRRGKGVKYREILIDVCNKLKVNFNSNASVEILEQNLLMKILEDAIDNMSSDEISEFVREVGIPQPNILNKKLLFNTCRTIFTKGGFKSYQLTVIIANSVLKTLIGRGLTLAGNATLTKSMSLLAGPVGLVINGVWTLIDIASSAYRVTIPSVIQIAVMRQQYNNSLLNESENVTYNLNAKEIISCLGCGQKVRLPSNKKHLIFTCPSCKKKWKWNNPKFNKIKNIDFV